MAEASRTLTALFRALSQHRVGQILRVEASNRRPVRKQIAACMLWGARRHSPRLRQLCAPLKEMLIAPALVFVAPLAARPTRRGSATAQPPRAAASIDSASLVDSLPVDALGPATLPSQVRACRRGPPANSHKRACGSQAACVTHSLSRSASQDCLGEAVHCVVKTKCIHPDRPVAKACADCPRRKGR